ncbi:hypothetical protein [Flectobacillus roseus]|uniref:hypothetical protein n=1 Tax=Flectobacillus roseus TaxID=502259 RepID=UPI0024B855E0|nr:hypothetical protein [Flectobacillus roseus]MDI9868938.1 hypothetical protein [Flectobacillus roseus]
MKKTFLITFLVYMGLTIFSCDNPKENGFSTTLNSNTVDSLELISTAFFKMDTLKQVPSYIQPLIKGKVTRVFKVDFDGDGKLDFICQYKPVTNIDKADFLEDWITSDKRLFKRLKKYSMDFDFFWFVNLDKDPEPEIFTATGYEDGIDYAFYDQDLKTLQDNLLFYFNPIIIENSKHYWGYPWDITDLILKYDSQNIYLQSSVDNDIERDGNITIPDTTKQFPAIFFKGHSTQSDMKVEAIRNIKWSTLDELK